VASGRLVARFRILIVATFLVLGLSCGGKTVTPKELVGAWQISDASRHFLPGELRMSSSKIVLDPDGTFRASEMSLDGLVRGDPKQIRLATGNGVWRIVSRKGRSQVLLEFNTAPDNSGPGQFEMPVNVSNSWSTRGLSYFLGDPDEGQRIEFEKR
jgi:hypothetical protein